MDIKSIARICHEANRALQIEQNDFSIPISKSWDELDLETKASVISGVKGIINGNTPEQSHENWCIFKFDHGWVFGSIKDEEKKEHPLLVPYNELPERQKTKDMLFSAIVKVLADRPE